MADSTEPNICHCVVIAYLSTSVWLLWCFGIIHRTLIQGIREAKCKGDVLLTSARTSRRRRNILFVTSHAHRRPPSLLAHAIVRVSALTAEKALFLFSIFARTYTYLPIPRPDVISRRWRYTIRIRWRNDARCVRDSRKLQIFILRREGRRLWQGEGIRVWHRSMQQNRHLTVFIPFFVPMARVFSLSVYVLFFCKAINRCLWRL